MKTLIRLAIHLTFYPTLWFSWVMYRLRMWRQWHAIDEHVLLGALPSKADLARLKAEGVGAVVNMCDEFRGHVGCLRSLGLEHLHLPTLDYFCPAEADIIRGLHFIDAQIAAGRKVYLHCKAGRGRSATLALVYLMRRYRMSVPDAYERLREARPHVSWNLARRLAVLNLEKRLQDGTFPEANDAVAGACVADGATDADGRGGPGWATRVVIWGVLGVATLMFHGCSIGDGLWLDDHWHQRQLRDLGWSFGDLLATTRLAPDEIIDAWWQDRPIAFEYARPFAVLVQKVVHRLSGGSVVAQHVVSLLLHVVAAALVFELCWRLTRSAGWSLIAGLLHVIYPLSVFAVGWLAAQNAVLQTVLTLAALLLYIRASGLRLHVAQPSPGVGRAPLLNITAFAAAVLCWVLALLSRENAIVFPVLMLAVDAAFGGRHFVRARWGAYAAAGVVVVAFVYWRVSAFEYSMPPVYVRNPDGISWFGWGAAKLMHYLTCAVWPAPMSIGPTGRDRPFVETPLDMIAMVVILGVILGGYVWLTRQTRGWWLWPLWLVLAVLPVVPVLATPHSGYLCGVGFAIGVVMVAGVGPRVIPFARRNWRAAVPTFVLLVSAVYLPVNWLSWRGMVLAERFTLAGLAMDEPPPPGTQLFFINLPFVNAYVGPCLAERWGDAADRSRCHVLTYSPDPVRVDQPCVVKQVDRHTLELSIDGQPYFSGLLGQFLVDAMRSGGPLRAGEMVRTDAFEVRIVEADDNGVRRLAFTFPKPLDSVDYRFYLTTFEAGATRLHFRPTGALVYPVAAMAAADVTADDVRLAALALDEGSASAGRLLFAGVSSSEDAIRAKSVDVLLPVVRAVAKATGSPMQSLVQDCRPDADGWAVLAAWWSQSVSDVTLQQAWTNRADFQQLAYRRDELRRLPGKIAPFVRLDLYLTGPPRRGPR